MPGPPPLWTPAFAGVTNWVASVTSWEAGVTRWTAGRPSPPIGRRR